MMAWSDAARQAAIEARRRKNGLRSVDRLKLAQAIRRVRAERLIDIRGLNRRQIGDRNAQIKYDAKQTLLPIKGRDY